MSHGIILGNPELIFKEAERLSEHVCEGGELELGTKEDCYVCSPE